VVLRSGAVSLDDLRRVIPGIQDIQAHDADIRRSPGMRHRHYSPSARVVLLENGTITRNTESAGYIGMRDRPESFQLKRLCSSVEQYARDVFEFFRECDRRQVSTIYCETVPDDGLGSALMDRLRRASSG
jgi:L-threonylcarbamoyladenylate synthase